MWRQLFIVGALAFGPNHRAVAQATPPRVEFEIREKQLVITVDERPIAAYIHTDAIIPRPYFAHVRTLNDRQVTRHHPPDADQDRTDHATMHPGIWMAFGDLDGADFWRNKAAIVHKRFLSEPTGGPGIGSFVEEKLYHRANGSLICEEEFRCSILVRGNGYLIVWDSLFRGDREFSFGDQEEMGLGLRVATPLSEVEGGQLRDSQGRRGANQIWSNSAKWCDSSGTIEDQNLGMTLICHPENFRESWMHARDYGFVAANAFGRHAMNKGKPSRVTVKPGENLRLRYGVWVHSSPAGETPDYEAAYDDFVKFSAKVPN